MPQKCYEKPNRTAPRVWTAKHVGQVACYAMKHGATRAQIEEEIAKCGRGEKRQKSSEAQQAMEAAIEALDASDSELNLDADFAKRFLSVTAPLLPIIRFGAKFLSRRIGLVGAGIIVIREVASARLKQIAVRTAANDGVKVLLKRAAANEARFLRSGTQ